MPGFLETVSEKCIRVHRQTTLPSLFFHIPQEAWLSVYENNSIISLDIQGESVTPIGPSACQSNGIRDSCERSLAGNRDGMD